LAKEGLDGDYTYGRVRTAEVMEKLSDKVTCFRVLHSIGTLGVTSDLIFEDYTNKKDLGEQMWVDADWGGKGLRSNLHPVLQETSKLRESVRPELRPEAINWSKIDREKTTSEE